MVQRTRTRRVSPKTTRARPKATPKATPKVRAKRTPKATPKTRAKRTPKARPDTTPAPRRKSIGKIQIPEFKNRDDVHDSIMVIIDNAELMMHRDFTSQIKNLIKRGNDVLKLKRDDKTTAKKVAAYNEAIYDVRLELDDLRKSLETIGPNDEPSGVSRIDPDFEDPDDE